MTSGILTAPVSDLGVSNAPFINNVGATLTFPGTNGGGSLNWFIDAEVTVPSAVASPPLLPPGLASPAAWQHLRYPHALVR